VTEGDDDGPITPEPMTMRYMLMMHAGRDSAGCGAYTWTAEEMRAHLVHLHALTDGLAASGELVDCRGLTAPAETRVVRVGRDGLPAVTDGPFPEAKEFLAGYWIVEVASPERAYEIAAQASAAPGPGGAPVGTPIEVRQVVPAPAPLEDVETLLSAPTVR
jgi:hypothetical protein